MPFSAGCLPADRPVDASSATLPLAPEDGHDLAAVIEAAQFAHQRWADDLVANLLAGQTEHPDAQAADAHHLCSFGQWYYKAAHPPQLVRQSLFAGLEGQHRLMHDAARLLLGTPPGNDRAEAYLQFAEASRRLILSLRQLIRALLVDHFSTDPLTGIANRQQMQAQLQKGIFHALEEGHPACLALADIDHFKRVNDSHGHEAGDAVLRIFAALLQQSLRENDRVYRYGGEEFLIFLDHLDATRAEAVLERMRAHVAETPITLPNGADILHITASFGLAQVVAGEALRPLIRRADEALYEAKKNGRNCIRVWGDPPALPA